MTPVLKGYFNSNLGGTLDAAEALNRHLEAMKQWVPGSGDTEFDERENRLCQDALRAFAEILPNFDLGGLSITGGHNDVPKLYKAGVTISVRPEMVVRGTTRQGLPTIGAVKLHFPKTHPLSKDAGEYVGVVLHEFAEMHLAGQETCDHRHCFVIDVSTRQIQTAPKNWIRRRSDVEAACREIATLWDSIPDI